MADEDIASDFSTFIDTGSYIVNALASGSLYGGIPDTKISVLVGDSQTGKTYFALGLVRNFQRMFQEGIAVFYDTEAAVTKEMMNDRGVDAERVIYASVNTVEEFRHQAVKTLDAYEEDLNRPRMMMVLDSVGQLSTLKEVKDVREDNQVSDMTRARMLKGTFRVLSLMLAKLKVPLICTNHQYANISGYGPAMIQSGGSGIKYSASTVLSLSKAKAIDSGKNVIGSLLTVTTGKSRFTKEDMKVKCLLSHTEGLSRYYGLIDLALEAGIWKKHPRHVEVSDGSKHFATAIYKDPETFFTKDVMEKLEVAAGKKFKYGSKES